MKKLVLLLNEGWKVEFQRRSFSRKGKSPIKKTICRAKKGKRVVSSVWVKGKNKKDLNRAIKDLFKKIKPKKLLEK